MAANEELQSAIAVLIKQISATGDFVAAQLPTALLDMLAYARITATLQLALSVLLVYVLYRIARKVQERFLSEHTSSYNRGEWGFATIVLALLTAAWAGIVIFAVLPSAIQVWFPKAYLLDYLRTFRY